MGQERLSSLRRHVVIPAKSHAVLPLLGLLSLGLAGTVMLSAKSAPSQKIGWLGVSSQVEPLALQDQKAGIKVFEVIGCPAATAGVESGDVILGVRDRPRARFKSVFDMRDLQRFVRYRPGRFIQVLIERDGRHLTLSTQLGDTSKRSYPPQRDQQNYMLGKCQ